MSSNPGSVGYISHVQLTYDYLGSFGVLYMHIWLDTKNVLKNYKIYSSSVLVYSMNMAIIFV